MTRHCVRVLALAAAIVVLGACAKCPRCVPSPPPKETTQSQRNWTSRDTKLDPFWWNGLINVRPAQKKFGTGTGATVAIVGTGVLNGHEDLPTVVPGKATCGSKPDDTDDKNGHGTQLAGIVAGRAQPEVKIPEQKAPTTDGVAPAAKLIPIKVDCGVVAIDPLKNGINAAIDRKPDVILVAIGGYPYGPSDFAKFMLGRVKDHPEILFVVASVWDGIGEYAFPDWTQTPNALLVAAMTLDAAPGDAKTLSKTEIPYTARRGNIWAPGRIVGTADIEPEPPPSTFHAQFLMHGTSPAAAIVAGCAALVKGKTGKAGADLKRALLAGSPGSPGLGQPPNNGRLNCAAVPER
jgi:subtilisin family serine protease